MRFFKTLFLLFAASFLVNFNGKAQSFTTQADTVFGTLPCNGTTINFDNPITVTSPIPVRIAWHVTATDFPSDWASNAGIGDNVAVYGGNTLSNGIIRYTDPSSTSILFWLQMYGGGTTTNGTFYVRCQLTDTATSYSKYVVFVITKYAGLANAGTISGPSSVCQQSAITLTNTTASNGANGTWSATNGNAALTPSGNTVTVTGVSAGLDTIKYMLYGCDTAVTTKIITVNPLANAGTISGPSSVCPTSTITLTNTATGGTWSAANGNVTLAPNGDTVVVTGVTAGVDTIMYTVSGCGDTVATKVITVNPAANAGTISGGSKVCIGSTLTLSTTVAGGTWSATNSSASVSGGIVTGNQVGIDTILYTVTNSCGTAVAVKAITVNPLPSTPVITMIGNGLTTTVGYDTYQWLIGTLPISGATNAVFTPTSNGTYAVTVSDTNGCSATSAGFNYGGGTDIQNVNALTSGFDIYPNPATDILNINAGTSVESIGIYNVVGKCVYKTGAYNAGKIQLNISELPAGLYLIKVNEAAVQRFSVIR
ncbi:T9SS type A sorting domain-containing protein [Taibaiella soli]|uniref:Secretion system C-terminal sorting domain-containing protein n=1 Tax=Taibaiella soli TaxID=1649169 RepID=A0A2W2BHZ0_9BACT|nr:T9SS type A sorting domain-containing protein [Taibaiella soli]PZF73126.1 hypothetical protein DN068_09645 [Taibaiella soli]